MTYLEQFTDEERDLLAALPYRAGVWIGEADSSGGEAASQAEMHALEAIVTGFVEDFCKSAFVEELMLLTLSKRDQWTNWRAGIEKVPAECRAAMDLLSSRIEARELMPFKRNLLEIAYGVATAYREYSDDAPLGEKARIYIAYWLNRLHAYLKKEPALSFEDSLSISSTEQKALHDLTRALRPDHVEGLPPQQEAA